MPAPPPSEPLEPVELTAGPVRLRPWREDDVDAVWAAFQDPAIRLWNGGGVASRTDALVLLGRRLDWSSGDHASWAVVGGADAGGVGGGGAAVLGSVSLHSIDRFQGGASVGYWTVPSARGRGLAAVAVDRVCRWAFDGLPVDRIELCHAVENTASGRVAERAGFTREGRLRCSYRYGDGVKHDEFLWSRLVQDPAPELAGRE